MIIYMLCVHQVAVRLIWWRNIRDVWRLESTMCVQRNLVYVWEVGWWVCVCDVYDWACETIGPLIGKAHTRNHMASGTLQMMSFGIRTSIYMLSTITCRFRTDMCLGCINSICVCFASQHQHLFSYWIWFIRTSRLLLFSDYMPHSVGRTSRSSLGVPQRALSSTHRHTPRAMINWSFK